MSFQSIPDVTDLQDHTVHLFEFIQLAASRQLPFNVSECSILQFGHLNTSQQYTLDQDHIPAKTWKKIWVLLL